MKKILLMAICLFFISMGTAFSVTLTLETDTPYVDVCDDFDVDLVISGLNQEFLSVGSFDVDIQFDTTQMSFIDYSLGTFLGDVNLFEALDFSLGEAIPGTIDLAEVSLLDPFTLDAYQLNGVLDEFTLATLTFHCDGVGVSEILIDDTDPWLFVGDSLATLPGFTVTVGDSLTITQTPEPTTLLLFGLGLISLGALRRKL